MEISQFLISNTHKNVNHLEKLTELLNNSKRVRIICPFISKEKAEWLIGFVNNERSIEIITELTPTGIATGIQLPSTLRTLVNGGISVGYLTGNLHAKVFVFDDDEILITSANLTNNGLENNFEVGVLFEKKRAPMLAKDVTFEKVYARFIVLWNDLKVKETLLNEASLCELEEIEEKTIHLRQELNNMPQIEGRPFSPIQKACENLSQVDIELQASSLFKGFSEKDWTAFDHGLSFNPENLKIVKQLLTDNIHPVLKRFYEEFRFARNLEVKLDQFDKGFSINRWVKNYFPDYRYLWLTKKREGKNPIAHIGEPSFIVGMGKMSDRGHWFEVRAGVEELNEPSLTPYGEALLRNMRDEIDVVITKFQQLGSKWLITNENNYSNGMYAEYQANQMSKEILLNIIHKHLKRRKIADFHIVRRYFMNDPDDKKLLTSSKILDSIATDMNTLRYFFELAHK